MSKNIYCFLMYNGKKMRMVKIANNKGLIKELRGLCGDQEAVPFRSPSTDYSTGESWREASGCHPFGSTSVFMLRSRFLPAALPHHWLSMGGAPEPGRSCPTWELCGGQPLPKGWLPISLGKPFSGLWCSPWQTLPLDLLSQVSHLHHPPALPVPSPLSFTEISPNMFLVQLILSWHLLLGGPELTEYPSTEY